MIYEPRTDQSLKPFKVKQYNYGSSHEFSLGHKSCKISIEINKEKIIIEHKNHVLVSISISILKKPCFSLFL
jgi:hypothetical protein